MTKVSVTVIGYRCVPYKLCIHNNSKGLSKLQRKISQSKKLCHTQSLGSHYPSSGHKNESCWSFSLQKCIHNNKKGLRKFNQISQKGQLKSENVPVQNVGSDDKGHGHNLF